ncbi:MAG: flagellar brake protein [Lachnospiraceae bacterium]|nr:flagellar brake protein [Lachnospiraceae bacterium]
MKDQIINIGDKVEMYKIGVLSEGEGQVRRQYISQLLEYVEMDKIKLAMPMEGGRIVPLTVGDFYEVCFYTSNGLYQSSVEIVDRYKEDNIYLMIAEFTSDLEKCQRRQYYRLEHIIDINYRDYSKEEEILERRLKVNDFANEEARASCIKILNEVRSKWHMATITDISGGGVRFNTSREHKIGSLLYMNIPIVQNGISRMFELKGEVVSSNVLAKRTDYYETRIKFVDIDRDEREEIVKFIFAQERKMLRKGMV